MSSAIALVRCVDYSASLIEQSVRQAISLLGGIDKFIKPRSRVLIKPNLLAARLPESGIVTHPELVRAVIRILKDIDAKIYVGDSPSAWQGQAEEIQLVWEESGIRQITQEENVELVRFNKSRWHNKFPLTDWLDKIDYLISLPKFKTHDLTILTGAIKNLFGLVVGSYKAELHKMYFSPESFSRMLVDLYEITRPTLTIVDGVCALEGEGPGSRGRKRDLGLIVAGCDCVSIDSILALIMGLRPEDILTTKQAAQRNLGNARLADIRIFGEQLETFQNNPFKLPITSFKYKAPKPVVEFIGKLIRFYPYIDSGLCTRCGLCIRACPQNVIKNSNGQMSIDYSDCISCFCCEEACPNAAIKIKRSIIAKLLRL